MSDHPRANEITKSLKGVDYPATGAELREHAKESEFADEVMAFFEKIPSDKEYVSPVEVEKDYGKYASGEQMEMAQDDLDTAA